MGMAVVIWACLLDAASQADPRGIANVNAEEIAVALDFEVDAVEAVLGAMLDKDMLDEDGHLTAWDTRQRTTNAERIKKHRAKKKHTETKSNAAKQSETVRNTTKCKNAPDTEQITDSEKEENTEVETDSKKDTDKKLRAREEKKESEEEKPQSGGKDQKDILQSMADIWNEEVQSKITPDQKAILTAKRKKLLTRCWLEEFAEDIQAWRYFCQIIGRSEFCLGKKEGKDWTIDLTWAIHSEDRIAKVLEGGVSDGKHPARPTHCELPEFESCWQDVIRWMEHHFKPPTIRSWFANTIITEAEDTPDGVLLTLECPREFVRGWIEQHFLTDLNQTFELAACPRPVVGVQLKTREANHG
jgi:hypothetical protein